MSTDEYDTIDPSNKRNFTSTYNVAEEIVDLSSSSSAASSSTSTSLLLVGSAKATKEMIEQKRLKAVEELARRRAAQAAASLCEVSDLGSSSGSTSASYLSSMNSVTCSSSSNSNSNNNSNSNSISSSSISKNSNNNNDHASSGTCQALIANEAGDVVTCGSSHLDLDMFNDFKEVVCIPCRNSNSDYDLITKTQIQKEYLISSENFLGLRYVSRENPKNKHWTQMKMYLRKSAKEMALRKFGSLEKLSEERSKREREAFDRESAKVNESLGLCDVESQQKRRKVDLKSKKIVDLLNIVAS